MITADQVLSELIRLQFFKFTPPEELNYAILALKQNFTEHGILDTDDEARHIIESGDDDLVGTISPPDRRIYLADAESLAEQGVCDFLRQIAPILSLEGVQLQSLYDEADWDEQGRYIYDIAVNGIRHRIFDEPQGEKNAWCLAHKRTVEVVNTLLNSAGSSECAYGQSFGNDAKIAILAQPLYEYIHTLPLKPYAFPMRSEAMCLP
jgi:hypothetical protein